MSGVFDEATELLDEGLLTEADFLRFRLRESSPPLYLSQPGLLHWYRGGIFGCGTPWGKGVTPASLEGKPAEEDTSCVE